MPKLCIPLSALTENQSYPVDIVLSPGDVGPEDLPGASLERATVTGAVSVIDKELLFQGRVVALFRRPCDRCLSPAEERIEQDLVWYFEPGVELDSLAELRGAEETDASVLEEEEDRARYYEGDELDLTSHVREELALALPLKFYCREACAGLCSRCGANLNEGACGCPAEEPEQNSGLAALKDLFPDA